MMNKCKLSIIVVTWNRSKKLKAAIESSFACDVPSDTEYIIIDNASSDDTEDMIKEVFRESSYSYLYKKLEKNIGCAPARNIGFDLSHGEYLYFMDDDLLLPEDIRGRIFIECIEYLDRNHDISVLTTDIYDKAYQGMRNVQVSHNTIDGMPESLIFHGGTHFLRSGDFSAPLYPQLFFGAEEWFLAMQVHDRHKKIVCNKNIVVFHDPDTIIDQNDPAYHDRTLVAIAHSYLIKKQLYPNCFRPILWGLFKLRCAKYCQSKQDYDRINNLIRNGKNMEYINKIKPQTVIECFRNYGKTVFI